MNRIRLTKLGAYFVLSLALGSLYVDNATADTITPPPSDSWNTEIPLNSKDTPLAYKKPIKSSNSTLSGIVQEALVYQPSIDADKHALSATEDVIDQAKAGYMPTIDLRASLGRDNIRRNFTVNSLNPLPSVGTISTTRSDPSITIRQILFDGSGTASRVARARSQRHQAHGTLGVTTDTAMVDAATATIDMRRLQRLLRIANNNIRFHQVMKQKVEEIVTAGAAPISDLYQVESRLQDTFVSKSNIQSDLEVATAKFIETVGKEPPDHIKRIKLPAYLMPASVEMAVRMALDNNNSIKVARSNVQIAETSHKESGSKLVPTISLELEGERDRNMNATLGYQSRLTAMVVARHNLFSGGADVAKARETVKRLTESHARLSLSIRQTERTIRAAWAEAKNSHLKSKHLTKLIKEKHNIRDTYVTEFDIGKRTLIDILDAANDVFITEATRTTVDATTDINMIVLSVGTGQFGRYIANKDGNEIDVDEADEDGSDTTSSMDNSDPDLQLTSYNATPSKATEPAQKITKVKKTPVRRKSIFEIRKEERQNTLRDQETAEGST